MTRTSLSFFLAAILFCITALVTMGKVEVIVTICTAIVAGICVVAGVATLGRRTRCAVCRRPLAEHCLMAPHTYNYNLVDGDRTPDGKPRYEHDHAFTLKRPVRQFTSDITPQRITNIRRRAEKKGYGR